MGQHFVGGGRRGQNRDLATGRGQAAQDVPLGPKIQSDHLVTRVFLTNIPIRPGPADLIPAIGLRAGDGFGQVQPLKPGKGACAGDKRLNVKIAVRVMGQCHMRCALLANGTGQAPRVHTTNRNTSTRSQPIRQLLRRTPVRRFGRVPFDNHAIRNGISGFVIFGIHADIADVGKGECHDLPGIGRIGHDFLVPGHRGVETQFSLGFPRGAESFAVKDSAICKCKAGGRFLSVGKRHVG